MRKRYLIVVDMQNDFIDGSLANEEAKRIVPGICELIKEYDKIGDSKILLTRDTHNYNYLKTNEGANLPIAHCINGTEGWLVNKDIVNTLSELKNANIEYIDKPTFGYFDWFAHIYDNNATTSKYVDNHYPVEEGNNIDITLVGTCTDICVISNALILKALFPGAQIYVAKDLCAGLSVEKHNSALDVMNSCQIHII